MDPAKLKVVDLRQELSIRGLDTKGIKATLVARLKEALEKETGDEIPNTSVADTSTEEFDTSQSSPVRTESEEQTYSENQNSSKSPEQIVDNKVYENEVEMIDNKTEEESNEYNESNYQSNEDREDKNEQLEEDEDQSPLKRKHENDEEQIEKNESDIQNELKEDVPEPRNKKSRWGDVSETDVSTENKDEANHNEQSSEKDDKQRDRDRNRNISPRRRSRERSPRKPDDEPEFDENTVLLSWYDSDLQIEIDKSNFYTAKPIADLEVDGLWSAVRATHGVNDKKVFYEVKLLQPIKSADSVKDEKNPFLLRLGWSTSNSSLQLGEDVNSYGFDGTGKKVSDNDFITYGKPFAEGDIVGTFLNSETDTISISFTVNGEHQGVAFQIPKSDLGEEALFPHIMTKNIAFEVNFGQNNGEKWSNISEKPLSERVDYVDEIDYDDDEEETIEKEIKAENTNVEKSETNGEKTEDEEEKTETSEDIKEQEENKESEEEKEISTKEKKCKEKVLSVLSWEKLSDDYVFIGLLNPEDRIKGPVRIPTREECEVIMMFGLPMSGKTYWVNQYLQENHDKKYTVLGPSQLFQRMTVQGKPRKSKRTALLDRCTKVCNKLIEIGSLRRRNYILDQTNILPSGQRRKMRSFEGFQRRAVVIVPSEEEYAKRQTKRAESDGKDVPESAVLEMKAHMSLPELNDPFVEVKFPELDENAAKALVEKYNEEGRKAGYGPQYSSKRPRGEWNDRRNRHGPPGGLKKNDRRPGGRWGDYGNRHGPPDRRHGGWGGPSGNRFGGGGGGGGGGWGGRPGGGRHGPPPGPPMRGAGYGQGGPWGHMGGGNRSGGGGYNSGRNQNNRGYGGRDGRNNNQGNRNRNSSGGSSGGNRSGPPSRMGGNKNMSGNQSSQGNWGGNQSGGNWGGQNQWGSGNQGGWAGYGNSGQWKGYSQGSMQTSSNSGSGGGSGNSNTGGSGGSSGSNSQNTSQNSMTAQSWVNYPNYAQWGNYYGQYGWGQGQQGNNSAATQMYNQYSQQWAQYAQQAGYGGYATTTSSNQQLSAGSKKDDKKS